MACNLELARRDTTLKHPIYMNMTETGWEDLGLCHQNLFLPAILDAVESDYTIPSPGGHLLSFYKYWLANGCLPRVVHILQWGYKIILWNPIQLSRHPTIHSGHTNQEKKKFLQEYVLQMLQKKAIVPIKMSTTLGFYSRLF